MPTPARPLKYWLREILTLPTAPFHEDAVAARVYAFARERGLKIREDRGENLLLEYRNPGARSQALAFSCHMDHPGFEVISVRGREARVRLLGGVDEKTLRGSRLVFHTAAGPVKARTLSVRMAADRRRDDTVLRLRAEERLSVGEFGQFDLPPLSLAGGKIRATALDNLTSAALILALMDRLAASRRKAHVYGLFTVAEEVGFVGAMESIDSGILPARVPLLVMETSRELPSFRQGGGPVIRVGDRMSVYDDRLSRWMDDRAGELVKERPGFRYQRALMPGGMCEASLFQLTGRPTGALALALDNYHNMGPRGAAAESVHRRDAEQMLELMERLALRGPDSRREACLMDELKQIHRRYRGRFKG